MNYSDEINAAVSRMSFGEKRDAMTDWVWWLGKQVNAGLPTMDFRDWLAERIESQLQREAERNNRNNRQFVMDAAEFSGLNFRIAHPDQLRGWSA